MDCKSTDIYNFSGILEDSIVLIKMENAMGFLYKCVQRAEKRINAEK